jgi:hypothetical protein
MAGMFDDLPNVPKPSDGGGLFGDLPPQESALNQALRAAATIAARAPGMIPDTIVDPLASLRTMVSPSLERIESGGKFLPGRAIGDAFFDLTGIKEYKPASPMGRIGLNTATSFVGGLPLGFWGGLATGAGGAVSQTVRELLAPSENAERLATAAGFVPGLAVSAMRGAAAPSAQRIRDAGTEAYQTAQGFKIDVRPEAVADMANGIVANLQKKLILNKSAPITHEILSEVARGAAAPVAPGDAKLFTIPQIEEIRRGLSDVRADFSNSKTERMAAGRAVQGIDQFFDNLKPEHVLSGAPEDVAAVADTYRQARANWAAAQRSNDLTGELDRGNTGIFGRAEGRAEAANSGRNFDNLLRQKVASFLEQDKNVYGFSDAEIAALEGLRKGGPVRNASRYIGNLLGGGGGFGQAFATGMAGAGAVAAGAGSPKTGLAAAAPLVIGAAAKTLENTLARRNMREVDTMVRQRSPLYQEQAVGGLNARDVAMLRALLPGLLVNQQQSQRSFGTF